MTNAPGKGVIDMSEKKGAQKKEEKKEKKKK